MRICRWNELYENAQSRKVHHAGWLPLPNKHDGEKYAEIFEQSDGAIIFACWILILQVASRSNIRGELIKDDGTSHTSLSLFRKTRCPKEHFDRAIPFLLSLGWIESFDTATSTLLAPSQTVPRPRGRTEQKGKALRKKTQMKERHIEALATVGRVVLDRNSIKEEF